MKRIVVLAFAVALSACASQVKVQPPVTLTPTATTTTSTASTAPTDPLAQLKAFTLTDLQAASTDAHTNNDPTAAQCYDFLIKTLPTLPSFTPGTTVGAFVAFQKLRDLNNGVQSQTGTLKSLNLACAPLVIDTQTVINKLLLIGAGAAATGGAIEPIAPVIGAALP